MCYSWYNEYGNECMRLFSGALAKSPEKGICGLGLWQWGCLSKAENCRILILVMSWSHPTYKNIFIYTNTHILESLSLHLLTQNIKSLAVFFVLKYL